MCVCDILFCKDSLTWVDVKHFRIMWCRIMLSISPEIFRLIHS